MFGAMVPGCTERSSPTGAPASAPALRFIDRASPTGIDFRQVCGGSEKDYIVEVNGAGVALFDYDSDGDLDLFFVNGARLDPRPNEPPPRDRLYRNDGAWKFTDVTDEAGIDESAWGCGVTVADIENDGDFDLYVTNLGPDELWVNQGNGTFRAEGAARGAADPRWGASATFLDYDRDGFVDLFVVNYLVFDRKTTKPRGPESCQYKGQQILCGPVGFPRESCTLYRNTGDGRFEDASERAGIRVAKGCYGLGVVTCDYDRDGWTDIYVSSDTTDNLLFHNLAGERFEEVGIETGVARNDHALQQAGMGVDFGFVRDAELEDLIVVNYEDDTNTYYRADPEGYFFDATTVSGIGCFKHLGWGAFFADFDLDGHLDVYIAQGHVVPQVDRVPTSPGYRQADRLFLGNGDATFRDVSGEVGPGLEIKKSSRGAAAGDLDGDGDLDVVVSAIDEGPVVLESTGSPRGHWLGVRLRGTRSNRAGIDAVVRVEAGGRVQARRVRAASSYASHAELTQRFGLGSSATVDRLEVAWPGGAIERFDVPGLNRVVDLVEGEGRE